MKYLKIALALLYASLVFILGFILCLLRPYHSNNAYIIGKVLAKPILQLFKISIVLEGNTAIFEQSRPVIFIANHQHNFDLILASALFKPQTVSMGKESLAKIPVFGQFYRLSGNILVDRSNPKKAIKAMKEVAKTIIERNISVWIFPEGKRNTTRPMIPFKRGAFISAVESKTPIVPIVIEYYVNRQEFLHLKPFSIKIKVLEAVDPEQHTNDDVPLHDQLYQMMEKEINAL